MVEQGQEALCKKALLKKYCRLSELEKRNYKTDQWISDIQQEATALYISCISDDYASFLKQAVSSHRKDIMKTIIVSISVALGLAFSILLFIGLQPTVNDLDKNLLPNDSLYSPYGIMIMAIMILMMILIQIIFILMEMMITNIKHVPLIKRNDVICFLIRQKTIRLLVCFYQSISTKNN